MTYAIQGLRAGVWVTLFAPIATRAEAELMTQALRERNPACRYQVVRL